MRKIGIAEAAQIAFSQVPPHLHVRGGAVETRTLFGSEKDPIHTWHHRTDAGAILAFASAPEGRLLYVWRGDVMACGQRIGQGGTVVIEHGAEAELRCLSNGCELVEFVSMLPSDQPLRPGGSVHALCGDRVEYKRKDGVTAALLAGLNCKTCALWLHENAFSPDSEPTSTHCHSANEVIFVIGGTMIAGRRRLGPGSALAVAANTFYTFEVASDGLRLVNFRPSASSYAIVGSGEFHDESEAMRTILGVTMPEHLILA